MPFLIVRNDITKMQVDAIVNAAKPSLLGGGGVDGAIHQAAGPALLEECKTLDGCEPGEAKITGGYHLPCKYVIHTVGPIWHGGKQGEEQVLLSCYQHSLQLAEKNGCETVAFPLISSGVYGYPKALAVKTATQAIQAFLLTHDMTVYLVVYDQSSLIVSQKLYAQVAQYIDDTYVEKHAMRRPVQYSVSHEDNYSTICSNVAADYEEMPCIAQAEADGEEKTIDALLKQKDEGFSEMLLRIIDERGMKDADCYKKANIDRKLFSKIRNDKSYHPSKPTVLAFAVALELSYKEACEMLQKAGFAFSHANEFDIIVEFFIKNRNYNIFDINEMLFAFDQVTLGC